MCNRFIIDNRYASRLDNMIENVYTLDIILRVITEAGKFIPAYLTYITLTSEIK